MSTSSLPVVERLLFLLMLSLASVIAKRSPLLHSMGSSRMAAGVKKEDKRALCCEADREKQNTFAVIFSKWRTVKTALEFRELKILFFDFYKKVCSTESSSQGAWLYQDFVWAPSCINLEYLQWHIIIFDKSIHFRKQLLERRGYLTFLKCEVLRNVNNGTVW